jgi:microcystin-dependent protein
LIYFIYFQTLLDIVLADGGDGKSTFNLPDTTLTFLMGAHGELNGRQLHVGEVLSGSVRYEHSLAFHATSNSGPNTTPVTINNQTLPLVMKGPSGLVVTYCICTQGLYPTRP